MPKRLKLIQSCDPMVMTVVLALVGVISLIGGMTFVLKYFQQKGVARKWWSGNYLKIIETLHVSPKHKVILISCDGINHLLLVGSQNDLLIQSGFSLSDLKKDSEVVKKIDA